MAEIQLELKSRRGMLKYVRRDLNQIHLMGKSAVGGLNPEHKSTFLAMYPSSSDLRSQYMAKFEDCFNLAMLEGHDLLFPLEEDLQQRSEVSALYYKIVEFQQTLSVTPTKLQTLDNTTTGSCEQSNNLNQSLARSRLPKISIPHYSGNIQHWPKFKQLFESIIHTNTELPSIEKYHFLSTAISGEAQALISALTINEQNYPKAWETLCKRYDNKRLLASSYIDTVLDYNPPKGPPTLSTLQSFIANIGESIAALKSIEIQEEADFIWLTLALKKLDPHTRREFEIDSVNKEWPTFDQLAEFIYGRCRVLQLSECSPLSCQTSNKSPARSSNPHVLATLTPFSPSDSTKSSCSCRPPHPLYQCPVFQRKTPMLRRSFLRQKPICFNCLRVGHLVKDCRSASRCRMCEGKHHTLLHLNKSSPALPSREPEPPPVIGNVTGPMQVLLGTSEAFIVDSKNTLQPIRLLLDCGSQFSLITSACARRLGLHWSPSRHRPLGAGETPLPKIKGKLKCFLKSKTQLDKQFEVEPLVVGAITGMLPTVPMKPLNNLALDFKTLADPNFWEPKPVDFLLGGDLFMKVITGPPISLDETYEALPTVFGMIVMGTAKSSSIPPSVLHCCCVVDKPSTDDLLRRFWETEEVTPTVRTQELDPCEEHYLRTHQRDPSGRYILALPFKEAPDNLEASMSIAIAQYRGLESKMSRNQEFQIKYHEFLQEYLDLGHMSLAANPPAYVIPHHGVFKSNEPNSKIRVVFNASARTVNGSLNDKLYVGPKLQRDLTDIILKFRLHKVAVTADLIKMYRQILIRPEDRRFQHILWRPNSDSEIKVYELNTVTYGEACAPFQAIRTVMQLVRDEGAHFPLAARALLEDCYVDDVVSGAESVEEACRLREELISLLGKGQFNVHKWSSNFPEFMQSVGKQEECKPLALSPKESIPTKILGMSWEPQEDIFYFQVGDVGQAVTKRVILSVIARLFDPMGYLAPVIFMAKTVLQKMWKAQIDWDETPEPNLSKEWKEFSSGLHHLQELKIPRHIVAPHERPLQVLGFCDASQKGFAACLYLRVRSLNNEVRVSLLKAKTKLAPLKTISVPRLELAAAHLLAKLVQSVSSFIAAANISEVYLFSDSTIVLAWLKLSPHTLHTFVANRVSFIISHIDTAKWFHVPSEENPADVASRGLEPALLKEHSLWWAGPHWLYDVNWSPTPSPVYSADIPEVRSGHSLLLGSGEPQFIIWFNQFSKYLKMLRTLAYIKRFIFNTTKHNTRHSGPLTAEELDGALMTCIRLTQKFYFQEEFSWEEGRPSSKRLLMLDAFLDPERVLRVGGRLLNADLPDSTKFPVILPANCQLTILLINHLHLEQLHMSHKALQALITQRFWIFRLRQTIKCQLSKCLTCFKSRARPQNPFMGNLPSCRVQASRPFSKCGVDFAGPFAIKLSSRRNAPTSKAYICLFICMATRAVHIELVSSLTTDAFLATLHRFVARRGRPQTILSDNGTNFVGAANRLHELFSWMAQRENQEMIQTHVAQEGFSWHFNPPHAPHFGGIWEAAIKSAKTHLYRVLGNRPFHFEELVTIFTRIEAILNSRPLCSMDENSPGEVLTPGHFLIGAPILAMPEKDLTDINMARLSRWQLVSSSIQHFWKRWHMEFLQTLQRRPKWYHRTRPLEAGHLVLIADPTSAPMEWKTARIERCHPGKDSIVRVVSIRDSRGQVRKLPVHKLVSLSHICEP